MGRRCLTNVRKTAPLPINQVKYTKTLDKAKKSIQSPPLRDKICPPFGKASFTDNRNSEFPCKTGKISSSPKRLPFKPSVSKRIRHAVFKSPFKAVDYTNCRASESQTSASSPPKLSTRSGQSAEFRKAIRTKDIATVNIDQVESCDILVDFKDMDAGCDTDKQNYKVQKGEFHSTDEKFVEIQSNASISSVAKTSFSCSVNKSCLNEAETSSTCIGSSKHKYAIKKSLRDETDSLQNADRPVIGKGCQPNKRRNLLSLRNKCANTEYCSLDNQKHTGQHHTASDGYQTIHDNHNKSYDSEHVFICRKQSLDNLKKHSQIDAKTETCILQTISPDQDFQEPITTTSINSVCQFAVSNKNIRNLCPRKMIELSKGSFPLGNRSTKIRAGNLSIHSCARTLGCNRLVSLKRDIEDFELKTSFKKFRRNMKAKN